MKIDDLIAQLEHWKSQGYIYARKEGKNWHLSSNQDFPDPYTQEYWQSIVHPDADWDNEDDWKEGKDFVNVKCLIEDLTIWGPNERSDGYLKIEVDLKPVNESDLPEWFDKKEQWYDYFNEIEFADLTRVGGPIFSCSF